VILSYPVCEDLDCSRLGSDAKIRIYKL
jgi:hypothetical protein